MLRGKLLWVLQGWRITIAKLEVELLEIEDEDVVYVTPYAENLLRNRKIERSSNLNVSGFCMLVLLLLGL